MMELIKLDQNKSFYFLENYTILVIKKQILKDLKLEKDGLVSVGWSGYVITTPKYSINKESDLCQEITKTFLHFKTNFASFPNSVFPRDVPLKEDETCLFVFKSVAKTKTNEIKPVMPPTLTFVINEKDLDKP